jgi:hypothetical protein
MRVCAVHQPNFFPWLGFFDKMRRSDVFVVLDRVHYQKSGSSMSSWCNRVKLKIGGRAAWVSCPVIREHGIQVIDTVRINDARPWRDDMRRILRANYADAPFFDRTFALVDELLDCTIDNLADFNVHVIRALARVLGCRPEIVRQSEMPPIAGVGTERLIAICRAMAADVYLSGDGAGDYLEEDLFAGAGVALQYQGFSEPPYGDVSAFVPGLSVIDRLMYTAA